MSQQSWIALGTILLVLLILGLFDKTRTIAIWIAVILGITIVLKKWGST